MKTRTRKADDFLRYIDAKFASHFIPEKHVCVDESVVKFKGKIAFIAHDPKKKQLNGL